MRHLVRGLAPWFYPLLSILAALLFLLIISPVAAQPLEPREQREKGRGEQPQVEFVPDQLLVRFASTVSPEKEEDILRGQGAARLRKVERLRVSVLRLKPGQDVEKSAEKFRRLPEVEFAEPNAIIRIDQAADPRLANQWAPQMIDLPEAWTITSGQPGVVIAVVDTGVDRRHPALVPATWANAAETPDNGLDDDGNGFVDDVVGWDFQNQDNDPLDDHFHGTHVAGIAAANYDDSSAGMLGVCPGCRIMGVKALDAQGSGSLDNVANAIVYAADNGARVINLSLGVGTDLVTLQEAVDYAWNKGAVVVAAAGNSGADARLYPAGYANAVAVASSNSADQHSCFSNFGDGYVSVAAPGEAIYSTVSLKDNGEPIYATYSGTSMATPHVAGLAGLLFSQDLARNNVAVRDLLEATTEDLGPFGADAHFGTGRINAHRALTNDRSATTPPEGMYSDDLWASGYANGRKLVRDRDGTLHLVWHARSGGEYRVLHASLPSGADTWSAPRIVFASLTDTFSPALTADDNYLYMAFPTLDGGERYRVLFTRKPLVGDDWSPPRAAMEGDFNATRPDLFLDPVSGRLHLVATGLDEDGRVFYASSGDGGQTWSATSALDVGARVGGSARYASVHATGDRVVVTGRTVRLLFGGLVPEFHLFAAHSEDGGATWGDPVDLAGYTAFTSEHGAALAGSADRLSLVYENAGDIVWRGSTDGVMWSTPETVGSGGWPSVTQADDGQVWVVWESDGNLMLRRQAGGTWDPSETVFAAGGLRKAYYPNLKLGTGGGLVEWAATRCNGSPYVLFAESRPVTAITENPTVQFSAAEYAANENAGTATVTVALSAASTRTVSVAYATSDGTARAGSDYTAANGTVTFQPGETSRSFTVTIRQDTVDEAAETILLTLSSPVNSNLGEPSTSQIVVADDDASPTVYLSATSFNVHESAGAATVTARLSAASGQAVGVEYATADGTARAGGDYAAASGTLTFAPGETSKTFGIAVLEDALPEANETVSVSLTNPVNATLGTPAGATVTILANDTISLGSSYYYVQESAGQVLIAVRLNATSANPVAVDYFTGDGTAKMGSDFAPTNGTLAFAPGETSKTVVVPLVDDTVGEAMEAFTFGLRDAAGAGLGSPSSANVTIWANDSLNFYLSTFNVQESVGQVTITVKLSGPSAETVSVGYATNDGSAVAGGDYTSIAGALTFAPGETSKTFAIPIADDQAGEPSESFTVTMSNPANASLGSPSTATVNIGASDSLYFAAAGYSVHERAGSVALTVRLSGPASEEARVDWATAGGTATDGGDFTSAGGTLVFAPGETAKTVSVVILEDALPESNETFDVILSNPANGELGSPAKTTVTIYANDSLTLVLSAYYVQENAGSVNVGVRMNAASAETVTVEYFSSDGTARSGSDYTAASGTLSFAPGETTKTVAVPIVDDALGEPLESFSFGIRNAVNAGVGGTATAKINIQPSDTLTFSFTYYYAQENAGKVSPVVKLSGPSSAEVRVNWTTANGTATAGSDYTPAGGTLVFAPGETSKTVTVPILEETLAEPNETFNLTLSNPSGAVLGSPSIATVTIYANDSVSFSSAYYYAYETSGQATITVRLNAPSSHTVTVAYAAGGGTATAGVDYTAVSGTLTFNPGETSKTFAVPLTDDTLKEPNETIELRLSAPTNASLGTTALARITLWASD